MEQTELFRVLASVDRQLLLYELLERDGSAAIRELAREIAAHRHRLSPAEVDDESVARAELRMKHVHLPHLCDRHILAYDDNGDHVSVTDHENVALLFEAATELPGWPPVDLITRPSLGRCLTGLGHSVRDREAVR